METLKIMADVERIIDGTTFVGPSPSRCYCDYETWPKEVLIIILLASIFCVVFSIVNIKEKNSIVFLVISSIMATICLLLLLAPVFLENI